MSTLFPAWPLMAAFLLASLALALTPGPAVIYVVTRTLAQGRRAGLASLAGVALGNLGNAVGAAIGLAARYSWRSRRSRTAAMCWRRVPWRPCLRACAARVRSAAT